MNYSSLHIKRQLDIFFSIKILTTFTDRYFAALRRIEDCPCKVSPLSRVQVALLPTVALPPCIVVPFIIFSITTVPFQMNGVGQSSVIVKNHYVMTVDFIHTAYNKIKHNT